MHEHQMASFGSKGRLHVIVMGLVQGVFFRASTLEQAQRSHLTGWVANLPDGAVELIAEGERYGLEVLLQWIHQGGPPAARVDQVVVQWGTYVGEFTTFQILQER